MICYNKLRNKEMDICRGLGIILVVCGHIGIIRRFAYLFHVPLFFFLSGYFFNKKIEFFEVILQAIKRYYVPFLVAEWIFLLFHNSLAGIIGYDVFTVDDIRSLVPKMLSFQNVCARLGQLWFLLALFSVNILYYFLVHIFSEKVVIVLASTVLMHYLLYEKTNIFNFEVCALYEVLLIMTAIYGIGNVYRKYEKRCEKLIGLKWGGEHVVFAFWLF